MKKYIIIDTWNGEGYTDSNAQIMEFENDEQALLYCKIQANMQSNELDTEEYEIKSPIIEKGFYGWGYCDEEEENAGAYYFEPYNNNIIGVVINPCINDYEVVRDQKRLDDLIEFAHLNGTINEEEEEEEWEGFMNGKVNRCYIHSGGESGDALFIRLPSDGKEDFSKDKIIKLLTDRLNACHTAMDKATDSLSEFNLTDLDAYEELIGELVENEELLKSIEKN